MVKPFGQSVQNLLIPAFLFTMVFVGLSLACNEFFDRSGHECLGFKQVTVPSGFVVVLGYFTSGKQQGDVVWPALQGTLVCTPYLSFVEQIKSQRYSWSYGVSYSCFKYKPGLGWALQCGFNECLFTKQYSQTRFIPGCQLLGVPVCHY